VGQKPIDMVFFTPEQDTVTGQEKIVTTIWDEVPCRKFQSLSRVGFTGLVVETLTLLDVESRAI
jgi:hypothetical protein